MASKMGKNNYLYSTILIVGTIVLTLLLSFFAIKPLYQGNQKLGAEVGRKKEKLSALQSNLDKLKVYKQKEEELKAKRDQVLAALPEGKDIPSIFIQFEKMVSNTGATVKDVKTQALANATSSDAAQNSISGISVYSYNLEATTSSYESFRNIITNTEIARRITDIKGFSIKKNDNSFDLTFDLETFAREDGGQK